MEMIYNCIWCEKCPFFDFEIGWCSLSKKRTWQQPDSKPTWCMITEVIIKRSE